MLRRGEEHQGFAAELGGRQGTEVLGGRDEDQVQLTLAQPGEEVVGPGLLEVDLHLGEAAVEALEQGGDVDDAEALLGPDPQRARQRPGRLHDRVTGRHGLGQHRAGEGQEGEARVGGFHDAGRAVEQRGAELVLQRADRGGEPRLRDAAERRGAGELPLVGEGDDVLHLPEVHAMNPTSANEKEQMLDF